MKLVLFFFILIGVLSGDVLAQYVAQNVLQQRISDDKNHIKIAQQQMQQANSDINFFNSDIQNIINDSQTKNITNSININSL